ncbi:MAG: BON domain-containing protein [Ferrovibrio sp.]|uniref:BON domain-containing protein n=1 Tax=Ferrovibrio sp. TaxID=1917215 RepID=UPI00262F1A6A|nr:BON domain-containing protein [Ferrovibrio sp.]MCW0233951.1 BON domain-containing protein [Ferrovibrio sp.]
MRPVCLASLFRVTPFVLLLLAVPVLQGCVGVAVGAGAATGVAAAEERGIKNAANDKGIQLAINDKYLKENQYVWRKLSITVIEGRVLLTGVVGTEFSRDEATRLAWTASDRIQEVINEVQVTSAGDLVDSANDAWITTQLRAKIATDKEIVDINYSIESVNGTVYLIGLAQNDQEITKVTDYARTIKGVRKVVSHVWLKTDPRRRPV